MMCIEISIPVTSEKKGKTEERAVCRPVLYLQNLVRVMHMICFIGLFKML